MRKVRRVKRQISVTVTEEERTLHMELCHRLRSIGHTYRAWLIDAEGRQLALMRDAERRNRGRHGG